jgi:hypothetical protein
MHASRRARRSTYACTSVSAHMASGPQTEVYVPKNSYANAKQDRKKTTVVGSQLLTQMLVIEASVGSSVPWRKLQRQPIVAYVIYQQHNRSAY